MVKYVFAMKENGDSKFNVKNEIIESNALKLKSNIKRSYLFHFLIGFYLISGVIIPFYLIWGRLTFFEYILLQSYYTVMIILFEIPSGIIADRLGKKPSLFLAGLSSAIGALIYGIMPNILLFIVGETLFAFGTAIMSGTCEALIYESLKVNGDEKEFSKIMSKCNSLFLIGIVISAPIGSLIAYFYSIPLVMTLMFIPYIMAAFITLTLHEPINKNKVKVKNTLSTFRTGFLVIKKNKVLRILTFDLIIIELLVIFIVISYQYYLIVELNIPLIYLGFIDAFLTLIQAAFLNLLSSLEKKVKNKKKLLYLNTLIPGIGYILIGIIFFIPIILVLIFITIVFGLTRYVFLLNGINKQIDDETRVIVLSTINMLRMVLKVMILPFIGILMMWDINIVFIILGILIILYPLKSKIKKEYL